MPRAPLLGELARVSATERFDPFQTAFKTAQRIIDFTSGATYSMNGNLQKISNSIFIATPESVELSGDFQELISGGAASFSGMGMRI